ILNRPGAVVKIGANVTTAYSVVRVRLSIFVSVFNLLTKLSAMKLAIAVCLVAVFYIAGAAVLNNELTNLEEDRQLGLMISLLKRYLKQHELRTRSNTGVNLYFSLVSSNLETKKHQQRIVMVLNAAKIPYEIIDIASSDEGKAAMRAGAGSKAIPPQIFNGEQYCGDYAAFDNAVEEETLHEFLKI
ncbi:unnamed protein product, partial [Owenia fusiformis]